MPFLFEQTKQIKIADTSSSLQIEPFPDASRPLPNAFSQMEKSLSEPVTDVSASCHNLDGVDAPDDTNDSLNTVSMVGITFIANLMNVKLAILNFAKLYSIQLSY